MNDREASTHQTLVRSRELFVQWVDDFSAGGAARQEFAGLQTEITEVERLAAAHGTGRSNAMQGTQTCNEAREALFADLIAIREAGKVLGVEQSSLTRREMTSGFCRWPMSTRPMRCH